MSETIKRQRMPFRPEFECKSIAGWAYKVSVDQLWRCYPEYDLDDMMGEAQLAFVKVLRKYPDVDNLAHFSSLFRITFQNQITSIANRRSKKVGIPLTDVVVSDNPDLDSIPGQSNDGGIHALALSESEAPPRIKALLSAFVSGPERGEMRPRPIYRECGRAGRRTPETLNEFLCRVAGVDKATDLVGEVLDWVQYGEGAKT